MEARGGVRCSARLSGEATRNHCNGNNGRTERPTQDAAAAAAAAALRRARAAERAREVEDSPRVLREKCRHLARALRNAKHLVVYTGAGISTAADIPDYRGPHGVWTRLQRGETVGRVEVSRAQPTFTHMALTALWARGTLKFVVSQNCDGLHIRAGLPRRALAELHGDMFAELCGACRRVYLRAFDTTERTARHAHGTRRLCHACGAELRDSIVHFGERGRAAWPLNWAGALRHAARADVVLCLGSSLKVLRRYPRLWRMQAAPRDRPALYIVNLQWTPKDAGAALKINARCDVVMRLVARRLRLRVPAYRARRDPLLAHAEPLAPPERHTTRRPLLACPAPPAPPAPARSPPASDSDEEVPLRRLAERLRAPPSPKTEPPADRRSADDRSSPVARFPPPIDRRTSSNERSPSPPKRFLIPNTHPPPVPPERFAPPNRKLPSSPGRPPSLYELLASPDRRPPVPKMRFLSPAIRRSPPLCLKSMAGDRLLSPNVLIPYTNERLKLPTVRSPLRNERPFPPTVRVQSPNERLTVATVQIPSVTECVMAPTTEVPPPTERFSLPTVRLPLTNDRLSPTMRLPLTDEHPSPSIKPPVPNERLLPPNVRAGSPESLGPAAGAPARPPSPQAPPTPAQPPPAIKSPTTRPPPDLLRAFQVSMRSGEATILLRAQHAPAPPALLALAPAPASASLALRSFRMVRPRPPLASNGNREPELKLFAVKKEDPDAGAIAEPKVTSPEWKEEGGSPRKTEVGDPKWENEEAIVKAEDDKANGALELGSRLRRLLRAPAGGEEALAAAYWARALLLCRAHLYPGLHTILAPPAPGAPAAPTAPAPAPPPASECAWCFRWHGAVRCLWYGPPRCTPPERRARRRRMLCACCEPGAADPAPEPQPGAPDTSGWYGKGYRTGRRRRR